MSWFHAAGFEFQEFSAGGVRTFAVIEGRQGGVPLVLLHGVPGASFVWSTTIQAVGRDTRVIAPDLPGWGRSVNRAKPERISFTREFLNRWLTSLLDAQGISEFDVLGHGNGAWLALDLLLADSARVRRLGLVNLPLLKPARKLRLPWGNDWTARRVERWVGSATMSETARRISKPLWDELFGATYSPKRSPEFPMGEYDFQMAQYSDAVQKFDGEALFMWGKRDSGYDEQLAREFAGRRRAVIFEDTACYPMWDEAEKYRTVVTEFLRD
ncbi:alpha/beta hydrolase [bacterium]|nr:alpha/beta hydrolase [bacterium]